jgi:NADH:ubiquinone oxidoreductase subunit 4 (subunit M)
LVLMALIIGLYPESVLGYLRASVEQLLAAVAAPGPPGTVAGRM